VIAIARLPTSIWLCDVAVSSRIARRPSHLQRRADGTFERSDVPAERRGIPCVSNGLWGPAFSSPSDLAGARQGFQMTRTGSGGKRRDSHRRVRLASSLPPVPVAPRPPVIAVHQEADGPASECAPRAATQKLRDGGEIISTEAL